MHQAVRHTDVSDRIDEVETLWIPLSDGRRLACRLFLPKNADERPVPAILEYIPYRRRDGTRQGDEGMHRWFASQGYACARVDIAGTGDSDGIVDDEYALREQDDGVEVIAWLAEQPWCSGAVGMIGISWGGFNGLQVAARRPPALAAVISLCSTVDRYHGDVHFTGGCLNEENLEWGAYFFTMQGLPPDPAIVGEERWRESWLERLDAAVLAPAKWLVHQRRDEFWRHGSVIEDLSAIDVPVLAVSGWADGYTNVVFDLVEGLSSPCKGIIGPWGHKYPQDGVPGPAIGFLQEATRWWDRWLKGRDTGVELDPPVRMWLQESMQPASHIPVRAGRWIGVESTPVEPTTWRVGDGRFDPDLASTRETSTVCSPVTTGIAAGQWCAYGLGKIAPELPGDQRVDDAGSLVFDSDVLGEALHLVGRPQVHLRLSSDRQAAMVAVRLTDVHPDGTSERLSYGVFNLCHHAGHEVPEALTPGDRHDVTVQMKGIAQTVPAGHRLRIAISSNYWPMIWPSPSSATITVHEADCAVLLPLRRDVAGLSDDVFGPPVDAVAGPVTVHREGAENRWITRDLSLSRTEMVASRDDGVYTIDDIGTEQSFTRVRSTSIVDGDPTSATASVECRAAYRRGGWNVRVESHIVLTCTAETFVMHGRLSAFEDDTLVVNRRFEHEIPRDHV